MKEARGLLLLEGLVLVLERERDEGVPVEAEEAAV